MPDTATAGGLDRPHLWALWCRSGMPRSTKERSFFLVHVSQTFSFDILQSLYKYICVLMDSLTTTSDSSPSTASTLYHPGLYGSEQFRVISISPGQWKDPIRCSLHRREFREPHKGGTYRALSYAWGSSFTKENIFVDAFMVKITLNLFCALRYLRKVDRGFVLWVDALVSLYNSLGFINM